MKQSSSNPQRFLVTTPGLSATRWLSFALASHPDVFVAHGKHPLDSVAHGQFIREKKLDDLESLTQGNLAADFYERESLEGIFAAYLKLRPQARAIGNVHTFTLEALMKKAGGAHELDGIKILNVLRHPVRYIASHTALVRSAEEYPLYQHYAEEMFPQAVRQFPELLLLDCEDFRFFLAFAVSCLSVCNLVNDFVLPQFRSVQMETLTTRLEALQAFCEELTGLKYSSDSLQEFIRHGAINQHRKNSPAGQSRDVWGGWALWQQDMARMMIPASVLDKFEAEGYDVSMLRVDGSCAPQAVTGDSKRPVPCLADRLREQNPDHPLLAEQTPVKTAEKEPAPVLVEEGGEGFNIVLYRRRYFALAHSIGPIDLASATDEALQALQASGQCFIGDTVHEARTWTSSRRPPDFDELDRRLGEALKSGANVMTTQAPYSVGLRPLEADLHLPLTGFGPPEMIEIEPIHTCNLRCVMCHVSYEKLTNQRLDVGLVLDQLKGWEGRWAVVGATHEPTAHPQFPQLIQGLHALGMRTQLTTNGTLLSDRLLREISGSDLHRVIISFDGARKETYETIRRNANYERTLERVMALKEMLAAQRTQFISNYTLMRSNLAETVEAVELWERLGFDQLSFILMVVRDRNELLLRESLGPCLDQARARLDEAAQAVIDRGYRIAVASPHYARPSRLKAEHPHCFVDNLVVSGHPGSRFQMNPRRFLQHGDYPGMHTDCRSPFKFVRILFDGDVQLCGNLSIGNIYKKSLQEIWFGEEANRIRQMVLASDKACRSCDYFRFCIKSADIDYDNPDNFFAQQQLEKPAYLGVPRLVEQGFHGFNLVQYQDKFWALAQSAGPIDLPKADPATLSRLQQAGACLTAESIAQLKESLESRCASAGAVALATERGTARNAAAPLTVPEPSSPGVNKGGLTMNVAKPRVARAPLRPLAPKLHLPLTEFGPPEMIEIEPIHTCNLRCVMCHVSYEKLSNAKLDVDVVLKHLQGLENRFVAVGATHEPAAHPQFTRLLRGLSELGMKTQLTTNGTLFTERIVKEIAGCLLDHVTISFDGVRKETYERIRRNANFDLAVERIARLRQQFANEPTFFFVNYTLMRSNLDEALEAVEFWDNMGFDLIGFILMVIRDRNELLLNESLGAHMDEVHARLDEVARTVIERGLRIAVTSPTYQRSFPLKQRHPNNFFSNMVMSDHPGARQAAYPRGFVQNGPYPGMHVDCRSPYKYARILYNGDVQLCSQFKIGNIHEKSLLDIWNGAEANRVRQTLQESAAACHACDYYRFCIKASELDCEREENFFAQHVLPSPQSHVPQLVEGGYKGFNLVRFRGRVYGLAQSLGAVDLFQASDEALENHRRNNRCVVAESARAAKELIDRLGVAAASSGAPRAAWPSTMENYFKQIAEGFQPDSEEGRRLRALYEELSEPPQALPPPIGTESSGCAQPGALT